MNTATWAPTWFSPSFHPSRNGCALSSATGSCCFALGCCSVAPCRRHASTGMWKRRYPAHRWRSSMRPGWCLPWRRACCCCSTCGGCCRGRYQTTSWCRPPGRRMWPPCPTCSWTARRCRHASRHPIEPPGDTRMTVFIFLGSLLAAMAIGVPIAYALLVSGVALMWHLDLFDAQILAQNVINGADSFPLLAVPFFMLAGEIMNAGGLSQRIVKLALTLVGHKRGWLGFVAILAACMLAALSGSAVADTAALAALLLPMMVKAGHDKARAGGLIASAGIIAPVIPPSIGFVVFGVAANVSISKLFLAGIVPGLLMGLSIAAAWYWVSQRESILPPPRATTAEKLQALKESTWALFLPVIVIVGLKMGVFTPTEAAAVAAVYALFVATVVYSELHWRQLTAVFVSAAKTTAVIMFLVPAAMVSAWLITVAD